MMFNLSGSQSKENNKSSVKGSKFCTTRGVDLCKFYQRPHESHVKLGDIIIHSEEEWELENFPAFGIPTTSNYISVETQTDFRESETQTDPWDPPYKISGFNEPEVLLTEKLTYGKGLPASILEVEHVARTQENKNLHVQLEPVETEEAFLKRKRILCSQVKNEWNYRISKYNLKQIEKLWNMEQALTEELNKESERKEKLLKNIWTRKKTQMEYVNSKLKKDLQKELGALDLGHHAVKQDRKAFKGTDNMAESCSIFQNKRRQNSVGNIDYVPDDLSTVKEWLERKRNILNIEIPLARPIKRNEREKISEKAYEDLLVKKCTKLPPKVYHRDYDGEESLMPSMKSDVEFEILELPEEGMDLVTVWQQVLRGRAYQKQMLELIVKHKDALEVQLHDIISSSIKTFFTKQDEVEAKN